VLYELADGGEATRAKPVQTKNEALELQSVLARNLFLLPGDQMDPDSPRRWLLIRKEMPIPDPSGGGSRWSVDLLLTDQSGVPTFVECKRYADTRSRREVVGQMLEYAANGHYYWDRAELRRFIEETAEKEGLGPDDAFSKLESEDCSDLDELLERFVENLREGQVRLVFFMEEAPQELKSIVDFLNRQTERTEFLIVEARQFDSGGRRFIVPALFGYTEEARRAKRSVSVVSGQKRRKWTEGDFFEEATANLEPEQVAFLRRMLDTAREMGLEVRWGTGTQRGSFSLVAGEWCRRSFASFLTDGSMWLNLAWLNGSPEAEQFRATLAERMREEVGLDPKGSDSDYWIYGIEEWFSQGGRILTLVRSLGDM
jgi:hypothetical protein